MKAGALVRTLLLLIPSLLFSLSVGAVEWKAEKGKVEFTALGKPRLLKIVGVAEGLDVKVDKKSGLVEATVTLELKKLATGISLRDRHMREKYLEIDNHPRAILSFSAQDLVGLKDKEARITGREFEAELELHGVKNKVKGSFDLNGANGSALLIANFKTKISDYSIPVPSFAGVTVADEVDVRVEVPSMKW